MPFFGICLGMQMAVVEFARNVAGLEGANSTEFDPKAPYPVVDFLPEQRDDHREGGDHAARRLSRACSTPGTKAAAAYGADRDHASATATATRSTTTSARRSTGTGMVISGVSPDRRLVEMIELPAAPVLRRLPVPPRVQVAAAGAAPAVPVVRRRRAAGPLGSTVAAAAADRRRFRSRRQVNTPSVSAVLCHRQASVDATRRCCSTCTMRGMCLIRCTTKCYRRSVARRPIGAKTIGSGHGDRDQAAPEASAAAGDDPPAAAGDQAAAALPDGAGRHGPRRDAREPDPRGRGRLGERAGQGRAEDGRQRRRRASSTSARPRRRWPRSASDKIDATAEVKADAARTRRSTTSTGRTTSTTRRRPRRCRRTSRNNEDLPSLESTLTRGTSLFDHLEWQLKLSHFSREEDGIGMLIIGNLTPDGYLEEPLERAGRGGERRPGDRRGACSRRSRSSIRWASARARSPSAC